MVNSDFAAAERKANEIVMKMASGWRGYDINQPSTRRCLKCREPFPSVGFHHRLCNRCRPRNVGLFENVQMPSGNWSDGEAEAALREGED